MLGEDPARTLLAAQSTLQTFITSFPCLIDAYVVVVYHVTIVAIGHGLLKKFWPLVLGCVLALQGVQLFELK